MHIPVEARPHTGWAFLFVQKGNFKVQPSKNQKKLKLQISSFKKNSNLKFNAPHPLAPSPEVEGEGF